MSQRAFGSESLANVPAIPEIVLGPEAPEKAITIDYDFSGSAAAGLPDAAGDGVLEANALYGRQIASPGKFAPFMFPNTVVTSYAGGTPSFDVPDNEAAKLVAAGPSYVLFDESAGALMAGAADVFTIVSIGAAGSGVGGAGFTLITLSGALTTAPGAGDRVVLSDGTQDPKNAVLVTNGLDLRATAEVVIAADVIEHGIYEGRLDESRAWNFPPTAAQQAWLKDQNQRLFWDNPQL